MTRIAPVGKDKWALQQRRRGKLILATAGGWPVDDWIWLRKPTSKTIALQQLDQTAVLAS